MEVGTSRIMKMRMMMVRYKHAPNFEVGQIAFGLSVHLWVIPFVTILMHVIFYEPCMHARVLKFHIWIPHVKNSLTVFFLSELCHFLELCPFEKIRMKSCQQDILKSIWPMGLKHGHLRVVTLSRFGHFKLVSKIPEEVFELGAWNLVSW